MSLQSFLPHLTSYVDTQQVFFFSPAQFVLTASKATIPETLQNAILQKNYFSVFRAISLWEPQILWQLWCVAISSVKHAAALDPQALWSLWYHLSFETAPVDQCESYCREGQLNLIPVNTTVISISTLSSHNRFVCSKRVLCAPPVCARRGQTNRNRQCQ